MDDSISDPEADEEEGESDPEEIGRQLEDMDLVEPEIMEAYVAVERHQKAEKEVSRGHGRSHNSSRRPCAIFTSPRATNEAFKSRPVGPRASERVRRKGARVFRLISSNGSGGARIAE